MRRAKRKGNALWNGVQSDAIHAGPRRVALQHWPSLRAGSMNHRAASGGVSNTLTTRVHNKLPAMNPQRFKFPQPSRASLRGPFRSVFYSKWATSLVNGAGATGANENIPSPRHRAKTTLK
jgi:hypothetical protein